MLEGLAPARNQRRERTARDIRCVRQHYMATLAGD